MAPHSTDSDLNITEVINSDLMQNKVILVAPVILCVCNSSHYRHSLLLYIVTFPEIVPAERHYLSQLIVITKGYIPKLPKYLAMNFSYWNETHRQ
jgi:hypothetical protein